MLTQTDIEKYFTTEKQVALAFMITGAVLIVLAIIAWLLKTPLAKGMAVPAAVLGIILLLICAGVHKRTDELRISTVYAFTMNPGDLQTRELPRMQAVNSRFVWIKLAEAALIAAGIVMITLYRNQPQQQFWCGFGLALATIVTILLIADIFAAHRAAQYTRQIQNFLKQ